MTAPDRYSLPEGVVGLNGPVDKPAPGTLPLRGDLAHIALAQTYLAAHYVIPQPRAIGSEPVTDADLRFVFTIGCFLAIASVLTALALERRRSRKLQAAYRRSEEALEELRGKYEGEVRWRMADKRSPPPASDMPSYTFEQKAQNAEPYALAASASPAAEMRTA